MNTNGHQKRTRSERVAALEMPPSPLERAVAYLRQGEVLVRIGLCVLASLVMWGLMRGWAPPFPYRTGHVPQRDIVARVPVEIADEAKTEKEREKNKSQAVYVYNQNPAELVQRRAELVNLAAKIVATPTLAEFGEEAWDEFLPLVQKGQAALDLAQKEETYRRFRDTLAPEGKVAKFKDDLEGAFKPFEQSGLLKELPPEHKGNQVKIEVHGEGRADNPPIVPISQVLTVEAAPKMRRDLDSKLESLDVAERVFTWLQKRLPSTLSIDLAASQEAEKKAAENTPKVMSRIDSGKTLAKAGEPLVEEKLELLRLEHAAVAAQTPFIAHVVRSVALWGMFLALYILCGFYIYYRQRRLIASPHRLSLMLGLAVVALGLCLLAGRDEWRAELIPLLLFGMTVAIAYQQELALLLSAAMSLIVVVAFGQGLAEFVVLLSAAAGAILLLGRIRSRGKLIQVGICSAIVAMLTTLGIHILNQHPLDLALAAEAGRVGLWAIVAGFLMTGLLPSIEHLFEVLTDLSLLELGDIAHPLLQELVRRATGTYNHSINVASIAEAAAEAIGGHGLLTRVGAYFHDIGKMLKPSYFIENQGSERSRHQTLNPAMSTLIIIAHIKDGADLARQHGLPLPIIDFIQQHHGTTLVEYFYHRASEQSEEKGDVEVDENAFRYPGPKPQTKEAGVLMLADAVESASRSLVDPTPGRIEGLVHDIALKRLLDGQFDECGLTLEEVRTIEDSLVKSLTAVYHGRVKYPEQRTA